MDIEELLKEGPSLTLTPEAAPELPAEEKKAEPKVYEEEQYLTEEEKKQVDAFVEQIQLEDSTSFYSMVREHRKRCLIFQKEHWKKYVLKI